MADVQALISKYKNRPRESITKEQLCQIFSECKEQSIVKKIEFDNPEISNNAAYINRQEGKTVLIVTDEKGTKVECQTYDHPEEAYASLAARLQREKKMNLGS